MLSGSGRAGGVASSVTSQALASEWPAAPASSARSSRAQVSSPSLSSARPCCVRPLRSKRAISPGCSPRGARSRRAAPPRRRSPRAAPPGRASWPPAPRENRPRPGSGAAAGPAGALGGVQALVGASRLRALVPRRLTEAKGVHQYFHRPAAQAGRHLARQEPGRGAGDEHLDAAAIHQPAHHPSQPGTSCASSRAGRSAKS
jgi:hypothetical protein